MDDFDNERDELLRRFKEMLRNPDSREFFSESDLVEIFDYAGDQCNDFIRCEVLRIGSRYYPDSQELSDRRAILYSELLTDNDLQEYLSIDAENNPGQSTIIREIIKLWSSDADRDTIIDFLKTTVEANDDLEDEEIIKLIGLALRHVCFDWILENFELLKKHTSNQTLLLYEVGYRAADFGMYDEACELLEQLVEQIPYSSDYWQKLAQAQFYSTKYRQNAEESLEMALAIDPNDTEALLLKAETVDDNNILSIDILEDIVNKLDEEDEDPVYEHLISLYIYHNQDKRAIQYLDGRIDVDNPQIAYLLPLIKFAPKQYSPLIDRFIDQHPETLDNKEHWLGIINQLASFNSCEGAINVLNSLKNHPEFNYDQSVRLIEMELLFLTGDYEGVLDIITSEGSTTFNNSASVSAMIVISMLKTGNIQTANMFAKGLLKSDVTFVSGNADSWRLANPIAQYGLEALLRDISRRTSGVNSFKFDPDSYNPLKL